MTSTVTNQSRTLVPFRANSGETWHIPPHDSITVMTIEIAENEKIRKLEELGLLRNHKTINYRIGWQDEARYHSSSGYVVRFL